MPEVSTSWVTKQHPKYDIYSDDQARQRASFLATRRALARFLVPHRFEGKDTGPTDLRRSAYGFGIGLNKAYLHEILGHVRSQPVRRTWGSIEEGGAEDNDTATEPQGGIARMVWEDATRDGVPWVQFFQSRVLEWILSSPGGLVVVDTPRSEGSGRPSLEEARTQGRRPYLSWLPYSRLEDFGLWEFGFRYVKLLTPRDTRKPKASGKESGVQNVRTLYELDPETGETTVSTWDQKGDPVDDEVNLGKIVDPQGQPMLPIVESNFGEHPEVQHMGTGLIDDLADIVIDLFNVYSETREGYRDSALGLLAYIGPDGEKVQDLLEAGTRYIDLGDGEHNDLKRVAGATEEVDRGMTLMDFGLRAWAQAARRKAAEAQERAAARSGIALQAEFQLDLGPLLTEVSGALDQIETNVMWVVGQMAGLSEGQLAGVGAVRATDFRPEDEASRIARIVGEARDAAIPLPEDAEVRLALAYLDALDQLDMAEEVEVPGGGTVPLREVLEDQVRTLIAQQQADRRNRAAFLGGFAGAGGDATEPPEEDLEPIPGGEA